MQDLIEEIKKTDADGIEKILKAFCHAIAYYFPVGNFAPFPF